MKTKILNQKYQIIDFLELKGYQPDSKKGNNYWYNSMIRQAESSPSLKVDIKLNLWYDHGIGIGGSLVDLAIYILKTNDLHQIVANILDAFQNFEPKVEKKVNKSTHPVQIIETKALTEPFLCNYLIKRGISISVAQKYCIEMKYINAGRYFKSIAFKNDSGGYEMRSEHFKSCTAPKNISFLNNGEKQLAVFEGFIDFLSFLQTPEIKIDNCNYLVLNSLSLLAHAENHFFTHNKVYLFFDNDAAGFAAKEKLAKNHSNLIDMTVFYADYKDLNDFLLKIKNGKQSGISSAVV